MSKAQGQEAERRVLVDLEELLEDGEVVQVSVANGGRGAVLSAP